jgi:two-component system, OmpR family, response regulator QseB
MHILLVEDDLDLGRALHRALTMNEFSCEWVRRIHDVPPTNVGFTYDGILLDLSLPDGTGYDLLARWRREELGIPIIIITARSTLDDRLAGLNGGADDFIIKPFAIPEMIARLHVVMRRYARQAGDVWVFGNLEIEARLHKVRLNGAPLALSPREFSLLFELAREPGAVISKGVLAQRLEPLGEAVDFGVIEVHMHKLRRKIGQDRIKTVRGIGYMLVL